MSSRLLDERRFHDRQAVERARTFEQQPQRLRFTDAEYLDHAPWIRPAFDLLGDVDGKRVLDWGCGHGMAAVVMARRGAHVIACDLSTGYCREAQNRATANEAMIEIVACNGERLPFADGSFDAIWGHAILHHLDVPTAAKELKRTLKPDGRVILCEPWDGHPFWRLARRWRNHTEHERALRTEQVRIVRESFEKVNVQLHQFQRYAIITCRPESLSQIRGSESQCV